MREDIIRASFSLLAAAVTLSMAQEWFGWASDQCKLWKAVPGIALLGFSAYEARKVWKRGERILKIQHNGGY